MRKNTPTADDYIDPELVTPGQEYNQIKVAQAKRILDENVSYLSKDCYMRLNHDIVKNKNPETIRVMLAYKNHHSIDLLVRNCMLLCNEQEYNMMVQESPDIDTRDTRRLRRSVEGRRMASLSSSGERSMRRSKSPYHGQVLRTKPRPKSSILMNDGYPKTTKIKRGSPLR